jgi:iron complex transport system substrate-binding protein
MNKKNIVLFFLLLAAGCGPGQRETGCPGREFTDDLGRKVMLPARVDRVISFAPSLTEMIYALGAGDKLVGVTSWCNWPPQAKEKPAVGDIMNPNFERMVSLKPDLVVMIGARPGPVLNRLESLGIKVLVFRDEDFSDIGRAIAALGRALGLEKRADSLNSAIAAQLDSLKAEAAKIEPGKRPKVFAEIGFNPLFTAGGQSFIGQMITQAGGLNIAEDMGDYYAAINPEKVVKENPDVILLLHPQASVKEVHQRLGWQGISALKNRRVYGNLDQDVILRPGPRFIQGLKLLHSVFYEKH